MKKFEFGIFSYLKAHPCNIKNFCGMQKQRGSFCQVFIFLQKTKIYKNTYAKFHFKNVRKEIFMLQHFNDNKRQY